MNCYRLFQHFPNLSDKDGVALLHTDIVKFEYNNHYGTKRGNLCSSQFLMAVNLLILAPFESEKYIQGNVSLLNQLQN